MIFKMGVRISHRLASIYCIIFTIKLILSEKTCLNMSRIRKIQLPRTLETQKENKSFTCVFVTIFINFYNVFYYQYKLTFASIGSLKDPAQNNGIIPFPSKPDPSHDLNRNYIQWFPFQILLPKMEISIYTLYLTLYFRRITLDFLFYLSSCVIPIFVNKVIFIIY